MCLQTGIRVGCSGWMYDSWRAGLYPEGLERYAERFSTVEINSTFYRLASRTARSAGRMPLPPEAFCRAKRAEPAAPTRPG